MLAEQLHASGDTGSALALLDEAFKSIENSDERWNEAELHRLRGAFLRAGGDHDAADHSLRRAVEIASRQGARTWALRASQALAHRYAESSRIEEASALLSSALANAPPVEECPEADGAARMMKLLDDGAEKGRPLRH